MCDCKKNNEARLREHFAAKIPAGATDLEVSLSGYAMCFTGPVPYKNYSEVTASFKVPTKGTTSKPSRLREQKQTVNLLGNYCMFCGEKYAVEEPEAAAAVSAEVQP